MDAWPDIMTVREAAGYLRVNPETLRRWLRERRIPGRRAGSDWRLRKADLDGWLAQEEWGTLTACGSEMEALIQIRSVAFPWALPEHALYGEVHHGKGACELGHGQVFEFRFREDGRVLEGECLGTFGADGEQRGFIFWGKWRD